MTTEFNLYNCIPFLDVLISWKDDKFEMTLRRKETHNDLYIHWETQAPIKWKTSTLKGLVRRAFKICSNEQYLKTELRHLKRVFHSESGYPIWFIDKVI